jgi:hypothetical protein
MTAAIDDAPTTAAVRVRKDRRLVAETAEVDGVTVSPFNPRRELARSRCLSVALRAGELSRQEVCCAVERRSCLIE